MPKNLKLSLAAVAAAALLAACGGGGGDDTVAVATTNLNVAATPQTASAVANIPFSFAGGVPSFGTTATTTLAFTSSGATPAFRVDAGGNVATGVTTFGSCIFTVGASTFTPPSPLVTGAVIRIDPCGVQVQTSGKAEGTASGVPVTLTLGSQASLPASATVTIAANGTVSIGTSTLGTVTVREGTGAQ
jgi:hypothetical protein